MADGVKRELDAGTDDAAVAPALGTDESDAANVAAADAPGDDKPRERKRKKRWDTSADGITSAATPTPASQSVGMSAAAGSTSGA